MSQTVDHDIDLALDEPPVRYVHTRWPSAAQMTANGAVAAMALLAGGLFVGAFTGRIDIESPVVAVVLVLLYALASVAVYARRHAESHAVSQEDLL